MTSSAYHVRAVHCDHSASDVDVYAALQRATAPLDDAWERLARAQRITVKFNQARVAERRHKFEGNLRELVDYKVARAVLRLLRERTDAEIVCTEISNDALWLSCPVEDTITLMPVLREFGVTFINGNTPPHRVCEVPGGGLMFRQYLLPESAVETDAFVSVQKMKSHVFMGVTLALKNLFGLPPTEPYGRGRQYFHHLVRLPYVLVDLGQIVRPTLSIIDALVGQTGREWNGEGRVANTLVAGDHVIATDACGTHLMGHDPLGEWPNQPFLREANALRIAHESGFGTADLDEIDFQSEVAAPVASFATTETDPFETTLAWRRSTCEQALHYCDNRKRYIDKYAKTYILLQDNEVKWHSEIGAFTHSRRELAGAHKMSAMWLKLVDPDEAEGEHYDVYEQVLDSIRAAYG
jgi:uncharacterized protein (DUF362 family)